MCVFDLCTCVCVCVCTIYHQSHGLNWWCSVLIAHPVYMSLCFISARSHKHTHPHDPDKPPPPTTPTHTPPPPTSPARPSQTTDCLSENPPSFACRSFPFTLYCDLSFIVFSATPVSVLLRSLSLSLSLSLLATTALSTMGVYLNSGRRYM